MKALRRVILLVHPQMRPDRARPRGATERDVWRALKQLGCQVEIVSMSQDLGELERILVQHRPQVVFNLLEEFRDEGVFDFHAVSLLEARGVPYTGCNPRGLIVSRHKIWATHLAQGAGIQTPRIYLRSPKYPAFIKYAREHASRGITMGNLVRSPAALARVRRRMRAQYPGELMVQEFIRGQDVTVSILGNKRPMVFEPWRLNLKSPDAFATERIKFSARSRRQLGIKAYRFVGDVREDLRAVARRLYAALDLSGYARLDFRVDGEGQIFFIDANANPNLARDEDFARAAKHAGLAYPDLVREVMRLATQYQPSV